MSLTTPSRLVSNEHKSLLDVYASDSVSTQPSSEYLGGKDLKGVSSQNQFRFAITIFLGSALLFCVEPMLGRTLLPIFGGTANVWSVCLVAYQVLLLCGALYAHGTSRLANRGCAKFARKVHIIHVFLLFLCAIWLCVAPHFLDETAENIKNVTWAALACVGVAIGLPFTILGAGSSLIQKWADDALGQGRETYRLYVISNIGSFVGLLLYPFILDPFVSLTMQWWGLGIGVAIYAICTCSCMKTVARLHNVSQNLSPSKTTTPQGNDSIAQKIRNVASWILFPALSTLLLNSVTTHLSTDVTPFPLMWVILLGTFLLSYIVGFSRIGEKLLPLWQILAIAAAIYAATVSVQDDGSRDVFEKNFLGGISLIFAGGTFLHAWLCKIRPESHALTTYYLSASFGGAIGGFLASIVAPIVFDRVLEYPIAIFVLVLTAIIPLIRMKVPQAEAYPNRTTLKWGFIIAIPLVVFYLLLAGCTKTKFSQIYERGRNFYGCWAIAQDKIVLNVSVPQSFEKPHYFVKVLQNGNTTHGNEPQDEMHRNQTTAYYGPNGGGMAFSLHPKYAETNSAPMRIAIVGMGIGTQAWYGRTNDVIRFFEIDPATIQIAQENFQYLSSGNAKIEIVEGDARKNLEQEAASTNSPRYDVLIIDAYSGDSVPYHLVTREAFQLYSSRLEKGGILALHISNWHVNLRTICKAAMSELGMTGVDVFSFREIFTWDAEWVFLWNPNEVSPLIPKSKKYKIIPWESIENKSLPTDDRGSILPYLIWNNEHKQSVNWTKIDVKNVGINVERGKNASPSLWNGLE